MLTAVPAYIVALPTCITANREGKVMAGPPWLLPWCASCQSSHGGRVAWWAEGCSQTPSGLTLHESLASSYRSLRGHVVAKGSTHSQRRMLALPTPSTSLTSVTSSEVGEARMQ